MKTADLRSQHKTALSLWGGNKVTTIDGPYDKIGPRITNIILILLLIFYKNKSEFDRAVNSQIFSS